MIEAAAAAADGSVARALAFLDEDTLALRQRALDELDRLPALNANALHAMGDALAGTDPQPLAAFIDTVNVWLSRRLDAEPDESGATAAAGAAGRSVGAHQSGRPRRRDLQFGAKALGLQRVRLACRGHARLIPMRRPWPGLSRP